MSGRRGRAGQRGAETLELVAILPLLGLTLLLAWQAVVLVRQQAQAQADARELARRAVLCARAAPPLTLADVDASPGSAWTATVPGHDDLVRVDVRLEPATVVPDFPLHGMVPHASVVMRREPC